MGDSQLTDLVARADVCVVAIAECFRGDGEILANPIGTIPMIGGRLARATFEPDLAMTDGEARLIADDEAFAWPNGAHFTSCAPDYERDEAFQKAYAASAKSPEAWTEFRESWLQLGEADYQAKLRTDGGAH